MSSTLTQMAVLDALTEKQREVIIYVSEGLTSKEIARRLGISESAVNQRIETIRQRLGGLPRAQIARLYRRQSTFQMTIPTSNSLTGNPIQLQSAHGAGHVIRVEGAGDLVASRAQQEGGVLQPSTISQKFDHALSRANGPWFRLSGIIALAAGMAATALLVLSVAAALDRLLAG